MDRRCWRKAAGLLLASVLLVASSMATAASTDPPVGAESAISNPFEGWEAWQLGGGVKLWFKQLAGVETVRVSAILPVGSQNDPEGLEGLAHFVEHVMFTDDRGRSEEEIKKEVKERGCEFFDASRVTPTSAVDGVHLDADQHRRLGVAIAGVVSAFLTASRRPPSGSS